MSTPADKPKSEAAASPSKQAAPHSEGHDAAAPADGKKEKKRSPNRLIVDDVIGDGDNSCINISPAKLNGKNGCVVIHRLQVFCAHWFIPCRRIATVPW